MPGGDGSSLSPGMAHRIEVELTSQTGDSTWTWRAAGAKQPRGPSTATLVPEGSGRGLGAPGRGRDHPGRHHGDRPAGPQGQGRARPVERIEILGTPQRGPDVNVVLASKSKRRRDEGSDGPRDGARRPRSGGAERGPPRTSGAERRPQRGRRSEPAVGGTAARPVPSAADGGARRRTGPARPGGRESGGRDNPRRLAPSTTYRNAALATLKPEQLPVAEQLLRGGIPSVRQAIEEQNARARADERPEVTPGPLLAMAEQLLPVINLATWKDRASVARAAGKDVPLRELRSIVASSSTVTLDEEGSEMATALRTSLDRTGHRPARALGRADHRRPRRRTGGRRRPGLHPAAGAGRPTHRRAGRPLGRRRRPGHVQPRPRRRSGWPCSKWWSSRRSAGRSSRPACPAGADEELLAAARKASGYVPELARLMGIPIPPPPGPRRPVPARSAPGPPGLLTAAGPPDRACTGRPSVDVAVHGEQPGLEPGRLVEVLRPPVAGQGGAVHPPAPRSSSQDTAASSRSRPSPTPLPPARHSRRRAPHAARRPTVLDMAAPKPVTTSSRVPTSTSAVGRPTGRPTGDRTCPGSARRRSGATSSAPPRWAVTTATSSWPSRAGGARRRRWPAARPRSSELVARPGAGTGLGPLIEELVDPVEDGPPARGSRPRRRAPTPARPGSGRRGAGPPGRPTAVSNPGMDRVDTAGTCPLPAAGPRPGAGG